MITVWIAMCITIYKIFAVEMCMTLSFEFYLGPRSNVNMPIESSYSISYLMTIVILFISSCYQLRDISKTETAKSLILKMSIKIKEEKKTRAIRLQMFDYMLLRILTVR